MRCRGPRGCQGFCDEMVPRFTDVVGRQWASDFAQVKAASGRFTLLPRSFHQSGPMARLLLSAGQLFPVARQLLPVTRQLWRWRNGERFGPNGEHFSENGDRFLVCTADTRTRTAKPAPATAVSSLGTANTRAYTAVSCVEAE